jgi:hypothetical protein
VPFAGQLVGKMRTKESGYAGDEEIHGKSIIAQAKKSPSLVETGPVITFSGTFGQTRRPG